MRLAVPMDYLEEHIHPLKTHVTRKVSELVLNLDELGSADWEDRRAKKVIAPAGFGKEEVYQLVSCRHRHLILLACVAAAGDALAAFLISVSPIADTLWKGGVRQDEDATIRQRSSDYLTTKLCYD
jgi:hypothetical protein